MQCEKCGEVFKSVDKYFLHRLGHRKIACQKCQQTFTSIANLTNYQKKRINLIVITVMENFATLNTYKNTCEVYQKKNFLDPKKMHSNGSRN